jgi:hypothetical protein
MCLYFRPFTGIVAPSQPSETRFGIVIDVGYGVMANIPLSQAGNGLKTTNQSTRPYDDRTHDAYIVKPKYIPPLRQSDTIQSLPFLELPTKWLSGQYPKILCRLWVTRNKGGNLSMPTVQWAGLIPVVGIEAEHVGSSPSTEQARVVFSDSGYVYCQYSIPDDVENE